MEEGIGKVTAGWRALGLSRSSYYHCGRSSLESRRIRKEVLELSAPSILATVSAHYRLDTAGKASRSNGKRVARIRREEGIKVSKKQRRMKRLGISTAERQRAKFGAGTSWRTRQKMEAAFAFSPYWTNILGNAWPFILRGRSGPSMS